MQNSADLYGQVAVITGGSSGLGRAAAASLAAAGAKVAVLARSQTDLEATVRDIADNGTASTALAVPVDLADSVAVTAAIGRVRAELGPVDILVNAAGTDVPGPVETLEPADWDRVLNVNLRAVFLLSQAVLPDMRSRGGGTIINIGSVAGRRGWANASAYCASKFALTGLTQALAAEGREHRIKVSLLYPGGMDTSWGTWTPSEPGPGGGSRPRHGPAAGARGRTHHLDRGISSEYGSQRNHRDTHARAGLAVSRNRTGGCEYP